MGEQAERTGPSNAYSGINWALTAFSSANALPFKVDTNGAAALLLAGAIPDGQAVCGTAPGQLCPGGSDLKPLPSRHTHRKHPQTGTRNAPVLHIAHRPFAAAPRFLCTCLFCHFPLET